jgi:hypothetical protein
VKARAKRKAPKGKASASPGAKRLLVMRRALLKAIPTSKAGIRFMDLFDIINKHLPRSGLPGTGSLSRTLTTVKLDLEARGMIERIPNSVPQRLRRTARRGSLSR